MARDETFDDVLHEMQAVPGCVGELYFHDLIRRLKTAHDLDLIKLYDRLTTKDGKEVITMGKCGGKKKGRKGGCKGK